MLQPLWLNPGEQLLTRLTSYIIIEVGNTLPQCTSLAPSFLKECGTTKHAVLKEREITKRARIDWQFVFGKRGRKGSCAVLSSAAGHFPLECVQRFAALEHELNDDEEKFLSAESDEEQAFTADSEEETCLTGVGCEQLSSGRCQQVVTCSAG
eukprot:2688960-Amphidinium_carterae.1